MRPTVTLWILAGVAVAGFAATVLVVEWTLRALARLLAG